MDAGESRFAAPLAWLAAAIAAAFAAATAQIGADARWLAAIGDAIVRTRRLPAEIPYAAAPSHWHDAPVLGQLVFSALERVAGDRGLVAANALAVAAAASVLALDCHRRGARDGAAAAALLVLVAGAPATLLVVRAQLFSVALFPLLLLLLREDHRRRSRRIWLVVPLLALWANLHGGVLVGFAATAVYLVLSRARGAPLESLGVLAASAAALFATPALLGSGAYYRAAMHNEAAATGFGLWGRPSLHDPLDVALLVSGALLLAAALRSRPALWEAALLLGTAATTLEARRNGIWLLLAAVPHAARALGRRHGVAGILSPRTTLVLVATVAALGIAALGLARPPAGASPPLLERALAAAHGSPILADPVDGEQLALRGGRVWIANPIDAYARVDQRRYLDWLQGRRRGDALLRGRVRVFVVLRGSAAQRRLVTHAPVVALAHDARAVVYRATS